MSNKPYQIHVGELTPERCSVRSSDMPCTFPPASFDTQAERTAGQERGEPVQQDVTEHPLELQVAPLRTHASSPPASPKTCAGSSKKARRSTHSSISSSSSKRSASSSTATDISTTSKNMAVLLQTRADLDEALRLCEHQLADMEGALLLGSPNPITATPLEYLEQPTTRTPSFPIECLLPGPSLEQAIRRKVDPRQRIFSQTSRTSAFWRIPGSSESDKYQHGVDTPPLGYYATDRTTTRARRNSDEGEAVVAYDAYRRRWVPVPRRQLERVALEQQTSGVVADSEGGGDTRPRGRSSSSSSA